MTNRGKLVVGGIVAIVLAALFILARTGSTPANPAPASAASGVPSERPEPRRLATDFQVPEQAEKYRAAMTEGNQRAVEVLTQALQQARAQTPPDQAQIAELEHELARRRELLSSLRP
jgi:hypothetical protein